MSNFKEALKLLKPVVKTPTDFMLYYDKATGEPLFYTMEKEEGNFIRISKEEFAECRYDIIVKDGKITRLKNVATGKLVPSEEGYGTTRNDVSLIGNEKFWRMKTYE